MNQSAMHTFYLSIFLIASSCKGAFRNSINEMHYVCGEGYKNGHDYVRIVDQAKLYSYSNDVKFTKNGCVEKPKEGQIFVVNEKRDAGVI